jgi:hypothetical protein
MVMASLITVATAMLPVIGCSISIVAGMEKFSENRNDKVFRQSFSNTLSGFFHKDVTELLPSKEAPAPDAELTSSTVSQNQ